MVLGTRENNGHCTTSMADIKEFQENKAATMDSVYSIVGDQANASGNLFIDYLKLILGF